MTEGRVVPAGPQRTGRRACPHCESPLAPSQDWCLNCGAAVSTRVAAPPGWRGPIAAVAGLLLLALALLMLAFFALADDAPRESATTDDPVTAPEPGEAPQPPAPQDEPPLGEAPDEETPAPGEPPAGEEGTAPQPAQWPAGEAAWTIVVNSTTSRPAARPRAQALTEQGVPAGVLSSNDFSSLRAGYWVVFSGQYESAPDAAAALQEHGATLPATAYVRQVTPR